MKDNWIHSSHFEVFNLDMLVHLSDTLEKNIPNFSETMVGKNF